MQQLWWQKHTNYGRRAKAENAISIFLVDERRNPKNADHSTASATRTNVSNLVATQLLLHRNISDISYNNHIETHNNSYVVASDATNRLPQGLSCLTHWIVIKAIDWNPRLNAFCLDDGGRSWRIRRIC